MADITPGFEAGDFTKDSLCKECLLGGTNVQYASGDLLKITGFTANGQWTVEKIAAGNVTEIPRGVLIKGEPDELVSGKYATMVIWGDVCVPVGSNTIAGGSLSTKGGKTVKSGEAASSVFNIGYAQGVAAANGDTVLIFFTTPDA